MLQQTTVAACIPYFEKWMEAFPTVESLALADMKRVLVAWQGLGYYRRARNLHKAAQIINTQGWPPSLEGWKAMPGIGNYTAGAIASIALKLPTPTVDGNIKRVYARLTADQSSFSQLDKRAWKWAAKNLVSSRAGDWNQALMELGATLCRPLAPKCEACPLKSCCLAHRLGIVEQVPEKPVRKRAVELHLAAIVYWRVHHEELEIGLIQAEQSNWWEGMTIFPTQQLDQSLDQTEKPNAIGRVTHTVTHHKITFAVCLEQVHGKMSGVNFVRASALSELPMPSAHQKIWKLASKKLLDL